MPMHGSMWHFLVLSVLRASLSGISSAPVNKRKQFFSGKNKPPLEFSVCSHLAYAIFQ